MAGRLFDHIFYIDFYSNANNSDVYSHFDENNSSVELKNIGYKEEERLHLVALTCYFLSCKFWERFPPKVTTITLLTTFRKLFI